MTNSTATTKFLSLDPNYFINLVEKFLGKKLTGVCRPYSSYINRVYELETEDGAGIVAKFYRPGRWSKEALEEEHIFLTDLYCEELPVIAPIYLKNNKTLGIDNDIFFSIFPKKGGRIYDEVLDDDWAEIGRLLGRIHLVGEQREASARVNWSPQTITKNQLDFILKGNFISSHLVEQYKNAVDELIHIGQPLFEKHQPIRIHGDLHFQNIIYRPGETFYLIDFDDMAMGPAMQDIWMLLPGYREDSQEQLNKLIEGYEVFREFPFQEIKIMEILRAMRFIHFTKWCAEQATDILFRKENPAWGNDKYWETEIRDINQQIDIIKKELDSFTTI